MKKILVGSTGGTLYYLCKQTDGWVGFTQFLSATPIAVKSVSEGLVKCEPDELSGLTFSLLEVSAISTLREMEDAHLI